MDTTTTTLQESRLVGREQVAEGTMAFRFARPAGFTFKAGQAIDLVLADSPGGDKDAGRHAFSLVSAPFETELAIATRMRDSAFKRALRALEVGSSVGFDGPFGSLTLHNDRARAAVFIAGGIGITPFMSILRQAARDRVARPLSLLYSNRRPEDAAFLAELERLARANEHFRLLATMTQMEKSAGSWDGEIGAIGERLVRRAGAGLPAPIFYVAGPPGMVAGVRKTLGAVGVDDDDVRSEEFFGY